MNNETSNIQKYLRFISRRAPDKYKKMARLAEVFLMMFVFAVLLAYSSIAISFVFYHALESSKVLFENLYYYSSNQEARADSLQQRSDSLQALVVFYTTKWEAKHPKDRPGDRYDSKTGKVIPLEDYDDYLKKKDVPVQTKFSRDIIFRAATKIGLPNGDNNFAVRIVIDGQDIERVEAHKNGSTDKIGMNYVGKTVRILLESGEPLKDNKGQPITYTVLNNIDASFNPSFHPVSYAKAYFNPGGMSEIGVVNVLDPEDLYDNADIQPIGTGMTFIRKSNKEFKIILNATSAEAIFGSKGAYSDILNGTSTSPVRGFSLSIFDDDVFATISFRARDSKSKEWKNVTKKIKFPPGDRYE